MSVNKAIILGFLGNDPEIKQNQSGDPIANISVATSEQWKNKQTGEKESKTEWHRCVLFGGSAKFASYLKKGDQVYLEGKIQTRKWTDKQGVDKWTTEIIIDNFSGKIEKLSRDSEEPNQHQKAKGNGYQPEAKSIDKIADENFPENDLDDDIPF